MPKINSQRLEMRSTLFVGYSNFFSIFRAFDLSNRVEIVYFMRIIHFFRHFRHFLIMGLNYRFYVIILVFSTFRPLESGIKLVYLKFFIDIFSTFRHIDLLIRGTNSRFHGIILKILDLFTNLLNKYIVISV